MAKRRRQSQKESNKKLVAVMKEWIKVEDRSIDSIREALRKIKNPLIKHVLRIIQHDSAMHKKTQQFIIDTLEKKAISLTPEELGACWGVIEEHIAMERATIELGNRAKENAGTFVQKYLVKYLCTDENKHDDMLDQLDSLKGQIYPYA